MRQDLEIEYREFVASRIDRLARFGYLLCRDWHRAEDAVQTALTRLYVRWPRLSLRSPDAYARRAIANALHDEERRHWFKRERSGVPVPDHPSPSDAISDRTGELTMTAALAKLPTRQRLAVVLRYWEDLSVEHTAEIMRCSSGTVKSQTSRGLSTLRTLLEDSYVGRNERVPS